MPFPASAVRPARTARDPHDLAAEQIPHRIAEFGFGQGTPGQIDEFGDPLRPGHVLGPQPVEQTLRIVEQILE